MNNNSYKNKYLKYKNKYLDLKKGGGLFKKKNEKEKEEDRFKKFYPDLYEKYKDYIKLLINNGFSFINTVDIIEKINNTNEDEKEKKKERLKKLIEYKIELDKELKYILVETDSFITIFFKYNENKPDDIKIDGSKKENIPILLNKYKALIDVNYNLFGEDL